MKTQNQFIKGFVFGGFLIALLAAWLYFKIENPSQRRNHTNSGSNSTSTVAIPKHEVISAKIIEIVDGDTAKISVNGDMVRIRLYGIDAPETAQDFGKQSKAGLVKLCAKANIKVEVIETDRYGRQVAKLQCDEVDAQAHMVSHGYAWVYDKYADKALYPLQDKAKQAHQGLWKDDNPTPPWEWRKDHK